MNNNVKVFAVVVTYNRCELLKKVIHALREQTYTLDSIIIVNNGSADGTDKWLSEQVGLTGITQENLGGSGGFWRGIKEAYQQGADYIWCMDDDVHPYPDCLEQYMKNMPVKGGILAPFRLLNGEKIVLGGECLHFNLNSIFKSLKQDVTLKDIENSANTIRVESVAFEGPIISRNVVEAIGLPEKDLFIFWDDTEYSYRAFRNGFDVLYVKSARFFKEKLAGNSSQNKNIRSWKYPYLVRNEIYFIRKYAHNRKGTIRIILRSAEFVFGMAKHIVSCDGKYKVSDYRVLLKALWDGYKEKLGRY